MSLSVFPFQLFHYASIPSTDVGILVALLVQTHSPKGLDATLKEKRSATKKYVDFFEANDDCPVCEQHIDETFKENMITTKKSEYEKFDKGINELKDELKSQEDIL